MSGCAMSDAACIKALGLPHVQADFGLIGALDLHDSMWNLLCRDSEMPTMSVSAGKR